MTRRRFVTCRFSEAQFERLDALAGARGLSRSAVIRALVDEASPDEVAPAIPDEDEVMRLLSERARAGNVSALKAVLAWHEHRRREQPAEPAGEDRMAVLEAVA